MLLGGALLNYNWELHKNFQDFYPIQLLVSLVIQSLTIAQQELASRKSEPQQSSLPSISFISVYAQRLR